MPFLGVGHKLVRDQIPQIIAATVWLFTLTSLVIVHYRIPIDPWHRAILISFVPYQLVFTTALTTIKGLAPLSELSDYQTRLRSVTGGQGSYSIDFSHYAPVPPHTQAQLVSKHKQPVEEEEQ